MLRRATVAMGRALFLVFLSLAGSFVVPAAAQALGDCKGPAELDQAVSKQPTSAAYSALGAYFARRNQFSCAMAAFERALKLNPKSWEAHYNFGLALRSTGELRRAASELHEAMAENPGAITPRIALGAVLEQVGNLSAAAEQYEGALKIEPHSTDALYNLAQVLSEQKRYTAAVYYLRQGVAVDPKDPSLGLALGIALSQNGNAAEAIHTLESVASGHPDFADGHFNLATLYAQDHRYLEAAKEYGEALRLQPQNDLARLSQAKALVTLAEYAKALPLLQEYIKQKPQDYEGYYLEGMADRGLGNYSEAELKLRRALELNPPGNYGLHYELGVVLEKLGRLDEARTHLERAEQLDPGSQEVRFHLANVLRKLQDEHRAGQELQAFQKMKEQGIQSARVGALANKANQLMEQGDARGAVAVYQQSLKLEPNDAKLYYNLSLAFNKLNDRSEEVSALRKAVAIDPDYGLAHNQLGLVYLAQANLAEAEQEFKTTLKIDSHFAEAENNLGVLYGQQGKNEEAEKLFRQAVEDNPLYGQAFANLGLILASQQRFEEAERQLRHALEITPKYSGALTALGRVQADAGRTQESVETFRRVVALEANSAEAHLNLGSALADAFDLEGALGEFSEVVRLAPQAASAHYNRGRVLLDFRRYDEARSELETAARLSPELSAPLFLLAVAEQQLHRADVSAEILRKLIALEPLNPDVHYLLAQNLFRLGKTSDAMQEWKRVLEINPDHVKALFDLSRALSKTRPVEARRYQDRLLGVQQRLRITGEAEMLQSFALVSANAREWPEALQQLREAVRICGECQSRAAIHKNLGLVYSRSGDLKNGERELRLALDLKPDDVETLKTFKMVQAAHH